MTLTGKHLKFFFSKFFLREDARFAMMQLAVLIFLYRFCRILVVMEPLRSFNIAVSFPVWGFSRSLYISVILEHFLSMRLKNVASL